MRTKIYSCGGRDNNHCFIDKEDFLKLIHGHYDSVKNYPNEKLKWYKGVDYQLMDEDDWIIEVSSQQKCMGQEHKYQVHCNFGRFPDEVITKEYVPAFRGWDGSMRYKTVLVDWIDYEENGGSANLYTNDRNGVRRTMLEEQGFKVVDID